MAGVSETVRAGSEAVTGALYPGVRALALLGSLALGTAHAADDTGSTPVGSDFQLYRPSVNGLGLLGLEAPVVLRQRGAAVGLSLDYARDLLQLRTENNSVTALISSQTYVQLYGAWGLLPWLELGVHLPLRLVGEGLDLSTGQPEVVRGLGDLRLSPRLQLLPARGLLPGVALVLPVTLPTGAETDLGGEPGLTFAPQLVAGLSDHRLSWSASIGYRIRPATVLEYVPAEISAPLGNELVVGLAGEIPVNDPLRFAAAVVAALGADAEARIDDPVELRLSLRAALPSGLILELGGGLGVSGGYGVPLARAIGDVSYLFGGRGFFVKDLDRDDRPDARDTCPKEAEDLDGFQDQDGCPDKDNDGDQIVDARDRCPLEPETLNGIADEDGCPEADADLDGILDLRDECAHDPEDPDRYQDEDGCPDPDNDVDGVIDSIDQCSQTPEDRDAFQDEDGCPDPDNDGDHIQDLVDACPNEAEIYNGVDDLDGCPDDVPRPADVHTATSNTFEREPDQDEDGLPDRHDACPRQKEIFNGFRDDDGCPERDTDRDGIVDGLDKCPRLPETVNGFRDSDGCPEPDADGDGIPDGRDACPQVPEQVNSYQDGDGCPETDGDRDGIPDGQDRCPNAPEIGNEIEDTDGCPD